jgi:F-type H+-transporting ATPase subunit delta
MIPPAKRYGGSPGDVGLVVEKFSTGETPLSTRYATALYALADEQNLVGETVDQMEALGRLIRESDILSRLVSRRGLDARQAAGPIDQALEQQGFSHLIRHFVGVIIANRRLAKLPALISGFAAYAAAKRGEVVAAVASAYPLTDLQRIQLRARLTEAGYSSVKLDEVVDPSLLGGLTLKIGPKLYDTSLKSRLQRLQYSLKGAA